MLSASSRGVVPVMLSGTSEGGRGSRYHVICRHRIIAEQPVQHFYWSESAIDWPEPV